MSELDGCMKKIATLIACHNRCEKTLACLTSLYQAEIPNQFELHVFLVDDGSTDETAAAVSAQFPQVTIIHGDGSLYWCGGMRVAWAEAMKKDYDYYLLLNNDTILYTNAVGMLLETSGEINKNIQVARSIIVGSTCDPETKVFSYGGYKLLNKYSVRAIPVKPANGKIQVCDFANANILFVANEVVQKIGILSDKFTHSLADYDYTLTASKQGIPMLVCANYCGTCVNDHDKNWISTDYSLSERIKYLKSPKNLAYNEYLFFIKRHFPFYLPISFLKLWAKTLFPSIWDKYKKTK